MQGFKPQSGKLNSPSQYTDLCFRLALNSGPFRSTIKTERERVEFAVIFGRIVAWMFIGAAFLVLGHDILQYLNSESWHFILLGELWYNLDAQGLNLTQAIVQRYLLPSLWDPVIVTLLLWPAWIVFLMPGILLALIFRKRQKNEGRGFSA